MPASLPVMPDIPGISFYVPQSQAESILVEKLKLLENVSAKDLLHRHLLDWVNSVPSNVARNDFNKVKEEIVKWTLKTAPTGPSTSALTWRSDIFCHPIIPLPLLDNVRRYRCLAGMVDRDSRLGKLYLDEEDVFPCPKVVNSYRYRLNYYGLATDPSWNTIVERVCYYARQWQQSDINLSIVESILETTIPGQPSPASISEIRNTGWLPGKSVTDITLSSPLVIAVARKTPP